MSVMYSKERYQEFVPKRFKSDMSNQQDQASGKLSSSDFSHSIKHIRSIYPCYPSHPPCTTSHFTTAPIPIPIPECPLPIPPSSSSPLQLQALLPQPLEKENKYYNPTQPTPHHYFLFFPQTSNLFYLCWSRGIIC